MIDMFCFEHDLSWKNFRPDTVGWRSRRDALNTTFILCLSDIGIGPPGLSVSTQHYLGPARADDDRSHVHTRGLTGIAFHAALPLSINATKFFIGSLPRFTKGAGLGTVPWAVCVSFVWSTEVMTSCSGAPALVFRNPAHETPAKWPSAGKKFFPRPMRQGHVT